jgi:WbqC-like protein family
MAHCSGEGERKIPPDHIRETETEGAVWAEAHWKTLSQNYRRAPYFGAPSLHATRKITRAVSAILAGRQKTLFLGNLDAAGLPAPGQGTQCLTDGRLAWLRRP